MSAAPVSRRRFGAVAAGTLASIAIGPACGWIEAQPASDGRITARPRTGTRTTAHGTSALGLESGRDAVLQIPAKTTDAPIPLLVLLHGAGGSGQRMLERLGSAPSDAGVAVLSPDSRSDSWDAVRTGFGPDVRFLNRALERVFDLVAVDPARLAIGGFSDGATYALSLGLINGDLFPRVAALSPGFVVSGPFHGKPAFFVSHGTSDAILPIDQCSRRIVPALRTRGYDVTFREFGGGHEVPVDIAKEAMSWIAK